jgi:hypothetical protein
MRTIVNEQERRDVDAAIRRGIREVQDAIKELQSFGEWVTPATIQEVTYSYFSGLVAPRIDAVKADVSLTEKERSQRLSTWKTLCQQIGKQTHRVEAVVEAFPELDWQFDETINNFVCTTNIDAIAEARATYEVPQLAEKHFELIQDCRKAVEQLREWEEAHSVKTMPLQGLVMLDLAQLSEGYLNGTIIINEKYGYRVDSIALKRLIV